MYRSVPSERLLTTAGRTPSSGSGEGVPPDADWCSLLIDWLSPRNSSVTGRLSDRRHHRMSSRSTRSPSRTASQCVATSASGLSSGYSSARCPPSAVGSSSLVSTASLNSSCGRGGRVSISDSDDSLLIHSLPAPKCIVIDSITGGCRGSAGLLARKCYFLNAKGETPSSVSPERSHTGEVGPLEPPDETVNSRFFV